MNNPSVVRDTRFKNRVADQLGESRLPPRNFPLDLNVERHRRPADTAPHVSLNILVSISLVRHNRV